MGGSRLLECRAEEQGRTMIGEEKRAMGGKGPGLVDELRPPPRCRGCFDNKPSPVDHGLWAVKLGLDTLLHLGPLRHLDLLEGRG